MPVTRTVPEAREPTKRDVVHARVLTRPGSSIADAAEAAAVTHPTASYHLFSLEKDGLVESHRHANKRLYFETRRFDAWDRGVVAALRSPETAAVLAAVWDSPWTFVQEAATRAGVSRITAAAAARRLSELGLVDATREGRTRTLVPARLVLRTRGAELAAKLAPDDPARDAVAALLQRV